MCHGWGRPKILGFLLKIYKVDVYIFKHIFQPHSFDMLIVEKKVGGALGEGLFDFGKSLFKKVFQSGLAQKAIKAVNSDLGKKVLRTVKEVANSELGKELQEHAVGELNKQVQKGLEQVNLPESVKTLANSDIGRRIQGRIVSEVGDRAEKFRDTFGVGPSRKRVRNTAQESLTKLGLVGPKAPKRGKKKKRRGRGVVAGAAYPSKLLNQFKAPAHIILE